MDRCGLPLTTYFSAPRLRWMLDHTPGLRARAEAGEVLFGTMESWLIWNLTGGGAARHRRHQRQPHDADEHRDAGLGRRAARRVRRPARHAAGDQAVVRRVRDRRRRCCRGSRIGAALGDQQAALFGQTCFSAGEAKCTYGTGSFLLLHTGKEIVRSTHGMLTTVAYQIGDDPAAYALEGSMAVTGSLVQWFRDGLGLIHTAAEIETLARTRRRQRRRVHRARVLRPVRTALAQRGPRA